MDTSDYDKIEQIWGDSLDILRRIFENNYDRAFGHDHEPDACIMVDAFANFVYDNNHQDRLEDYDLGDLVDYFLDEMACEKYKDEDE